MTQQAVSCLLYNAMLNAFSCLLRVSLTAPVVYWSEFVATQRSCIVLPVRYELNLYMLCRRK
jgi:hypothetical protein